MDSGSVEVGGTVIRHEALSRSLKTLFGQENERREQDRALIRENTRQARELQARAKTKTETEEKDQRPKRKSRDKNNERERKRLDKNHTFEPIGTIVHWIVGVVLMG